MTGVGLAWVLAAALAIQIVLLIVAGWHGRYLLNTDAIAYLRIASYYASGQMDLMVSGYWGPLLSWLVAPLLKLPQQAGHALGIGHEHRLPHEFRDRLIQLGHAKTAPIASGWLGSRVGPSPGCRRRRGGSRWCQLDAARRSIGQPRTRCLPLAVAGRR